MKGIRRFVTEIHRRSLWQVLAIFVATGWAVLQVLDVMIQHGMLPGWVFKAGFVLLLLGLPVVLATAFIQEGVSAREADPEARVAGPSPAADTPLNSGASEHGPGAPRAHHRLFTWRNAIVGGVAAFALLGVASVGYMGMRTFGIGSPGTLLAQGVLERGAPVLLADFESNADAELGDVVTHTLRIDLMQSPALRVLERSELAEALTRMQTDQVGLIGADVAVQLAEREGYAAVITGKVAPAGTGYVLTASILGGAGFRPLAGFRETARSDAELVDAIERLSRAIRDKVGESLRSVRGGPSLAQVTTASLPALRAYTRGLDLESGGDYSPALEQYERAVALDSTFAMAYRKIAVALQNLQIRPEDRRRASIRAYELRDRLPELERHIATGFYHVQVSGDIDAAVRAYEQALLIDSLNASVSNNLANNYSLLARYDEAARLYARSLRDRPFLALYTNLARTRYEMGDRAGASATLDSATVALPDAAGVNRMQAILAAADMDHAAADSLIGVLESRARTAGDREWARHLRGLTAAMRGHVREAERLRSAAGAELWLADPVSIATDLAELQLLRGDTAGALRRMRAAVAERQDGSWSELAAAAIYIFTEAGAAADATEVLKAWQAEVPADARGIEGRVAWELSQGRVALARRDYAGALESFGGLRQRCPGCGSYITLMIARTYDAMGDADRAIAEYKRGEEMPDVNVDDHLLEYPRSLRRLAELYDARGDSQEATVYYSRFVELWQGADPELQPWVRTAQARLRTLLPDR
ncbi:hypothetical protein BH23GEM3_BH23GEM3_00410 [soil metagenome]